MPPPPRSTIIAFFVSLLLAGFFFVWASNAVWLREGDLYDFDQETARDFKSIAEGHHTRRHIMIGLTLAGSVTAMGCLALAGAAWQWRRGDQVVAIAWITIVISGGLLTFALKKTYNRPRPPVEWRDEAVHETNESFPSGHSMGSMIGYGMLGYASLLAVRRPGLKLLVLIALAVVIGLIGFSRIYLRAHWFSDVIGGFTIGAAWLTFCLAIVTWVRHTRSQRPELDSTSPTP